jgi:RimJ/RimL family protein N-acetyltransferase
VRYGFETLELEEIVAFTAVINERSWRLMERLHMRKDITFDHPKVAEGHRLRPHILYRLTRDEFRAYDARRA